MARLRIVLPSLLLLLSPLLARGLSCDLQSLRRTLFDPYETLAIDRSAREDTIRSAYRALALRHAPNKFEVPTAEQQATYFQLHRSYE